VHSRTYDNLPLGGSAASVVALAERLGVTSLGLDGALPEPSNTAAVSVRKIACA
jgi:hypothetical protein